jgi:hypothetical protein
MGTRSRMCISKMSQVDDRCLLPATRRGAEGKSVVKKRGRPPGALNKKTRAVLDQARKEGITPLEVRLRNMRRWYKLAVALESKATALSEQSPEESSAMLERAEDFRQRPQEFAVAALSFVHRRLGRVKCIVDPEPTVVVVRS